MASMARKRRDGALPEMAFRYRAYPRTDMGPAYHEMHLRRALWNQIVEMDTAYRDEVRGLTGPRPRKEAIKERPAIEPELDLLDVQRRNKLHDLCAASGLHWANRDDVRTAYGLAVQQAASPWRWWKERDTGEWCCEAQNLRHHSVYGPGKLIVRPQKTPRFWCRERYDENQETLELEIGADRQPVALRVRMHRPLPADATIQRIELIRAIVGYAERWHVIYIVETSIAEASLRSGERTVAIDLGWEINPDGGLRVAHWQSATGDGDLVLPAEMMSSWDWTQHLQSVRDRHYDAARNMIEQNRDQLPDWLLPRLERLEAWKSSYRLCEVMDEWYARDRNVPKDQMYMLLQGWARREHHLAAEQSNLRERLLHRREWLYGVFAAQMCRDYDEVSIGQLNLRSIARRRKGKRTEEEELKQRNRVRAGISTLQLRLKSTARREGVRIVTRNADRQESGSERARVW